MKTKHPMEDEELNLVTLAQEYADEDRAIALLESMRWPDGAKCPHCAAQKSDCGDVYRLRPKPDRRRPGRKGLWKCAACRKQFTVRVGTIFGEIISPLERVNRLLNKGSF